MRLIINAEVRAKPEESQEKLLKRFVKKCKKLDVIRDYLDHTSFAQTKSQKRREKVRKNRYLRKFEKSI